MHKAIALVLASCLIVAACSGAQKTAEATSSPDKGSGAGSLTITATDMVLGDPNAPVTLIEYASLTCPACAAFAEQILPSIKAKFIDAGKVRLVYREYPAHHPELSLAASVLVRCAAEKTGSATYFMLNDALFKARDEWAESATPRPALEKVFADAGFQGLDFDACVQRKDLIGIVNDNARGAMEKFDVNSTPTFILDGKRMKFSSAEDFEGQIAAAVEKAAAK